MTINDKLTSKELADRYAAQHGVSKEKSRKIVSNFLETLKETIKDGESVQLYGIGSIEVYTLPAGEVYDRLNKQYVTKPERNKVKFKFTPAFRKYIE